MKFLRVPELAAILNVSSSWIYKRLMSPEARERNGIAQALPCRYVGGCVVFDPKEIAEWLEEQPRRRRKRSNDRPAPSGEAAT